MQIRQTKHSKQRLKERHNLGKKAERKTLLTKAITYGKPPEYFTGELREYLISKRNKYKYTHIKVYENFIYIYRCGYLVTSYAVPEKFLPIENNIKGSTALANQLKKLERKNINFDFKCLITQDNGITMNIAMLYIDDIFECLGQGRNKEEAQIEAIKLYLNLSKEDRNGKKSKSNNI